MRFKAKTFVHELMHGLGLKYRMNQFRCADGKYRLEVVHREGLWEPIRCFLGTANSPYFGLGAQPKNAGWGGLRKRLRLRL